MPGCTYDAGVALADGAVADVDFVEEEVLVDHVAQFGRQTEEERVLLLIRIAQDDRFAVFLVFEWVRHGSLKDVLLFAATVLLFEIRTDEGKCGAEAARSGRRALGS